LWYGSPAFAVYRNYLASAEFFFARLRALVFDQMIPRIAHYWPREIVEGLGRAAGLDNIRLVHVNEMSWSASGRKPSK
jgi:hypothetical protein